ncbi:MAG: hypothetical protein O3A55_05475 [Bacteroidetes bacterium]|nr:hypothetical protein [Bacteroidota bacterium]
MFEEHINLLKEKIRMNSIDSNESIILRVILESNIPQSIKVYFRAQVKDIIRREKENLIYSDKLPFSNQDVITLQNQIDLLLFHNYKFSKDDFFSTLDQGINFSLNYLVRPQWTLKEFLFQKSQFLTSNEIEDYFHFCADFSYYGSILKQFFETKEDSYQLSIEELQSLLKKIDLEVLSEHSSIELAKVFTPLFKLISYTSNEKIEEVKIPTKAAILFFEDKGMTSFASRLSSEKQNGLNLITLPILATILERVKTGNNEFIALPELFKENEEPKFEFTSSKLPEPIKPEAIQQDPDVEIDLQNEVEKKLEIYPTTQPLMPMFTLQEKQQIIYQIFDGNENECDSFIVDILDATDLENATEIINIYFDENKLDEDSQTAQNFIKTLKERYLLLRSV